jgi:hypothetical protein
MTTPTAARLDRNWRAITIELDAPRPGRIERTLRSFGLPARITRVMVSTPALRRAWFAATAMAIVVALSAADQGNPRDDLFMLLLLAPLVPVLGVALAYGVAADPAHEVSLATPMRGIRLILIRAAVVLGLSFVALCAAALLTPGRSGMAFAWLIPSLGLTSIAVGLMTALSPRRSAMATGVAWIVGVFIARGSSGDPLAAFEIGGQIVMSFAAAIGLVITVVRRGNFDHLTVGS